MAALLAFFAGIMVLRGWDEPQVLETRPGAVHLALREPLVIDTPAGKRLFEVEVARTAEQQATGLMFRTSLADDAGMLFVHDTPHEVTMWMRNTYIPLDMVFIKADGTVSRIAAMTTPLSEETIASAGDVVAVLEIAGGAAKRLGIAAGDRVSSRSLGSAGR
jgi:uncharacterized membrane protein (UPF0127 family)